jgi:ATP synthase protein I
MSDNANDNHDPFPGQVDIRERRKLRARKRPRDEIWFGLGMFGLVGWSVAIPTVFCTLLGVWIDVTWPGRLSWTLMCLVFGLILGCANAWFWLNRQRRMIDKDRENGVS